MPNELQGGSARPAALLWDNDGVLVDTERLYFEASREVLAGAGVELTSEQFVEISLRCGASCLELATDAGASPDRIAAMRAERDRRYTQLIGTGVPVIDGVREVLATFHGQLPMAIVTSSKREHFDAIHAAAGLLEFFDFALTAEDYERTKPHPEPYLAAAARLDVEPSHCVAIEDTERGVKAAVAAGMPCLAIPNELISEGDFSAAWQVLGTIHELPGAIARYQDSAPTR